jgi:translation initiation factor eIF-2B subunit alpha
VALQIATVAKAFGKPFYVAAESYKFARLFPLNQRDLPVETRTVEFALSVPESVTVENPSRDYTPPHLITLLFTDLGVLTPSAISDELIQLFS